MYLKSTTNNNNLLSLTIQNKNIKTKYITEFLWSSGIQYKVDIIIFLINRNFKIFDIIIVTDALCKYIIFETVVKVVVWYLDLLLPMQSVPITTTVVSSNPTDGEVCSIQHYVIKCVSNLQQAGGFLRIRWFPPTNKTVRHAIFKWNIAENGAKHNNNLLKSVSKLLAHR